MNLMGGHIWVESEGLGKGTSVAFFVELGVCKDLRDLEALRVTTKARPSHGSADFSRHKPMGGAEGKVSRNQRYQRSL